MFNQLGYQINLNISCQISYLHRDKIQSDQHVYVNYDNCSLLNPPKMTCDGLEKQLVQLYEVLGLFIRVPLPSLYVLF